MIRNLFSLIFWGILFIYLCNLTARLGSTGDPRETLPEKHKPTTIHEIVHVPPPTVHPAPGPEGAQVLRTNQQ